jgi:hypothetical protein
MCEKCGLLCSSTPVALERDIALEVFQIKGRLQQGTASDADRDLLRVALAFEAPLVQNHWTERGRATSVSSSDVTDRPRRSVLSLGITTRHVV